MECTDTVLSGASTYKYKMFAFFKNYVPGASTVHWSIFRAKPNAGNQKENDACPSSSTCHVTHGIGIHNAHACLSLNTCFSPCTMNFIVVIVILIQIDRGTEWIYFIWLNWPKYLIGKKWYRGCMTCFLCLVLNVKEGCHDKSVICTHWWSTSTHWYINWSECKHWCTNWSTCRHWWSESKHWCINWSTCMYA